MDNIFSESNIVNKEYYEGIKSMINCLICLNIIENPVQCTKCQHYFCSECITDILSIKSKINIINILQLYL